MNKPKILLYDIETAPMELYAWSLYDLRVGTEQIIEDTFMISWSAKWLDSDKIYYMDQRNAKDIKNDKQLVKGLKKLLDQADMVITHNGIYFDEKVVNGRLAEHGLHPLLPNKHIDTYQIAKKYFRMTSNKLEYIAKKLKTKHQKYVNRKFNGFSLWKEVLKQNLAAWKDMERYNKHDTLVLQDVYLKIRAWDKTYNPALHSEGKDLQCECGSRDFANWGHRYTMYGKYQRLHCKKCGKSYKGKINLLQGKVKYGV